MKVLAGLACAAIAFPLLVAHAQPQASAPGVYTTRAALPAARNETTAAVVNGKIYVIGGNFPSKKYDVAVNEEYDPAANAWRARAPMPSGLNHIGSAALNGKIYIVGGFTSNGHKGVQDKVFEYDPAADAWKTIAPLSSPRGSVAAAVVGGKLHAFGGRNDKDKVVADHEIYDPTSGKWTAGKPLPRGRDHMAAVTVGDKIHIVGGRYGANSDKSDLHEIYDPATDTYTSAPPVPTARGGGAGTLFQGMIVFLGGEDDDRGYNENEGFVLKDYRWMTLKPMPTGRHGFGLAALGSDLYIISGARSRGAQQPTDETLVFRMP